MNEQLLPEGRIVGDRFVSDETFDAAIPSSIVPDDLGPVEYRNGPSPKTETVPVLPGSSPDGVAAPSNTVTELSVNSPTEQLVKALMPVGAYRTDDHRYWWNGKGPFPSVTTVLGILDKPAVVTWKAKEAVRAILKAPASITHDTEEVAINWALKEADKERDTAAALGSSVHLLADLIGGSETGVEAFAISDREIPYVEAFRAFLARYSASSIVSSEKMVWNLNGYAGTYDLLMHMDCAEHSEYQGQCPEPELWLIDIKTSKGYYPEYGLQLAAYAHADQIILPGDPRVYPMPLIQRTGILHLRPDAYPDTGYRLIEYPTSDRDYIAFLGALEVYNWKSEQRFLKSKLIVSKP